MSLLFSPLKIRETTFKNRMVVSSMCMYSAQNGYANDFHLVHLGARAIGGFALVMQEATAVAPEGRISPDDLGIWEDGQIEKLKQIVDFCHTQNALVGVQLAHAGRKASQEPSFVGGAPQIPPTAPRGWQTFGPSPIAFRDADQPPIELDEAGLKKVKEDFLAAVHRAQTIGYDVIEIHAAHGYLLHQFYSPVSNHRTDRYGGSFENRIRFPLEIIQAVRKEWEADKPLFVRLSATDWKEGGWTLEDSVKFAKELKKIGVDLVDTSSGGNLLARDCNIPLDDDYQTKMAGSIRSQADIKTGAVGRIRTVEFSKEILENGQADLLIYARESLRNPNLPLTFADELNEETEWPKQYLRAKAQSDRLKEINTPKP